MKKLYKITALQTFVMTYVIEAEAEEHALDEMAMIDVDGFDDIHQQPLPLQVIESQEISEEDYLNYLDSTADWYKSLTKEFKLSKIHKIDYER